MAAPTSALPSAPQVASPADLGAELARLQRADGSYGDSAETVAALLCLLLQGHTRHQGLRKRNVQKAAAWLSSQPSEARVDFALAQLERAERGEAICADASWWPMAGQGRVGRLLASLLGA
jgi:hypothetical protein